MTNVRSVVAATLPLGTKSDGAVRRTGQRTWQNVPGASRPSLLATSSSTAIVRVATSTACAIRATVPDNVWPGYAATVKGISAPSSSPRCRPRAPGRRAADDRALDEAQHGRSQPRVRRRVRRARRDAHCARSRRRRTARVTRRYPSMSRTALSAWRAASTFCWPAATCPWLASAAFPRRSRRCRRRRPAWRMRPSASRTCSRSASAFDRAAASCASAACSFDCASDVARRVPAPRAPRAGHPRARASRDRHERSSRSP